MMSDPVSIAMLCATGLAGLGVAGVFSLKGWKAYLDLRRLEVAAQTGDASLPPAGGRIEIADLKERVRKLEAIASGIDL